jgi:uncharacterized protein
MRDCARSLSALAAGGLLALALAAPVAAEEKSMQRQITVTATGEVQAEPDIAHIQSGVVTDADSARDALRLNTEAMTRVISGLKEKGIAPADIQTSSFRVEPRYSVAKDNKAPTVAGYRVVNAVSVVLRQIDKTGETLDALVALGANQMSGLNFEVTKAETLKDEARKAAVSNAQRRAKLLAEASGATLGEVLQVAEETQQVGFRPVMAGMAKSAGPVPVERGTETLQATVTITWALR